MSNGSAQINSDAVGEFVRFESNLIPYLLHIVFWGGLVVVGYFSYQIIKIGTGPYGRGEFIFYGIIFFAVFASAIRVFCEAAMLVYQSGGAVSIGRQAAVPAPAQVGPVQLGVQQPAAAPPPMPTMPTAAANPQPAQPANGATTSTGATIVFCNNCGQQSPGGKKFCTGCGATLPQ